MTQQPFNMWGLPIDISTHGAQIDSLIVWVHVFMAVLFVGWGIYFLYCLIRFRERPGHQANLDTKHFKLPSYLEVAVLLVEVCLLVFLSSPVWARYKNDFPPESESLVVRMVAEQFAWNFHYPGRDGKFGATKTELMDGTNPVGLDRSDPAGADDLITINQFNVPINKPVILHMSSKDVIHSFFIPVMRVKQDVVPGMSIPIHFQAKQTGEFEIACAQLCGLGHYRMRGAFNVMDDAGYAAFIAEEEKSQLEQPSEAEPTGEGSSQ